MEHSNKDMPINIQTMKMKLILSLWPKPLGIRKNIIKITLIFMGVGLFVALTSPSEYTSSVVVNLRCQILNQNLVVT